MYFFKTYQGKDNGIWGKGQGDGSGAEVIVTAFPSDSSQRSLIVRGHLILLSQKLDGPWEVSPYPIAD